MINTTLLWVMIVVMAIVIIALMYAVVNEYLKLDRIDKRINGYHKRERNRDNI